MRVSLKGFSMFVICAIDFGEWELICLCLLNRPLESKDIAQAAVYMLSQPLNISVKALDVVPSGK